MARSSSASEFYQDSIKSGIAGIPFGTSHPASHASLMVRFGWMFYAMVLLGIVMLLLGTGAMLARPWDQSIHRTAETVRLGVFFAAAILVTGLAGMMYSTRRQLVIHSNAAGKAHAALIDAVKRWHGVFDQAAIGIATLSCDGRFIVANQKFCDMLGYTHAELVGRSYREITYPADLPEDDAQAKRLVAGDISSYSMEKRYLRKDGSLLWARLTCSLVQRPSGSVVAIVEDITARKRAEEDLRESEEKFRMLTENAPVAFGIVRGERFTYANRHFAEMSGYSKEELLRMDFPQLVDLSFQPMMKELARRRQAGEPVPSHYEFLMKTRSGERRWIDFSPAMIILKGQPAIIGTGFDVTQRKEAEEALARAKEVAEAANSAKDHFLAMLSHELRTPLAPVLATVAMLQESPGIDDDTRDSLEVIHRNIDLEACLIDDLLDVTRIARGKIELDKRPVEICTIIRRAVEVCKPEIEGRGIRFSMQLGDLAPYIIDADAARLQQVFWNLLKNANKFTPPGGSIDLHCHLDLDGHVVVEVADTGEGIEPGALHRIFNAFEQAGRTITRQFGGLGLGLTISKALVEMHGGTIEAHSEGKGKGATFRVVLPLSSATVVPASPPQSGIGAGDSAGYRQLRILLVEDHRDTARIMKRLLRSEGHDVQTAGDVATALRVAQEQEFDLLISDLGLPDGSGLDVMRALRRRGLSLPGIALSGFGRDDDIRRSKEAGFSTHLTKPVDFRRLKEVAGQVAG